MREPATPRPQLSPTIDGIAAADRAAPHSLAVCGWENDTLDLVTALRRHARLVPVAVGDPRPAQLVRARADTALPCYQHLSEMMRTAAYEAVLLHSTDVATRIAGSAAERGADLLLIGDQMSGAALGEATHAAVRHGVALAVIRPWLRRSGIAAFTRLARSEPAWSPHFADIELRDDREASALLRDGVALTMRMLPEVPSQVAASVLGADVEHPLAIVVHLRYADGRLITLSARTGDGPAVRGTIEAAGGHAELRSSGADAEVIVVAPGGSPQRSTLHDGDLLSAEAERVASARRGHALDAMFATREAATLVAIEEAITTGAVQAPVDPTVRASLRVLRGGGLGSAERRGELHLIS